MQVPESGGLAVDRTLVGEQLPGLAPVDHLRRAAQAWHPPVPERHRPHLPGQRLHRGDDADVDDTLTTDATAQQLTVQQPLPRAELELAEVDAGPPQSYAVVLDLSDAPDADEDAPALHGNDQAVDPRRPAPRSITTSTTRPTSAHRS